MRPTKMTWERKRYKVHMEERDFYDRPVGKYCKTFKATTISDLQKKVEYWFWEERKNPMIDFKTMTTTSITITWIEVEDRYNFNVGCDIRHFPHIDFYNL